MTISRRLALGGASAFAVIGGAMGASSAAVAKSAAAAIFLNRFRNLQTSQRFLELLIHRDESGNVPYTAEISIPAPDTAWFAVDTLDDLTYRVVNHQYKKRGYRLRRVSAFKTKAGVRYSGCWELASGPEWYSNHGMTHSEFEATSTEFAQRGCRMTHVDARIRYAAIWEHTEGAPQQIFAALTLTEYEQQFATLTAQGFRPMRISATAEEGTPRFTAIFENNAATAWKARHQMSAPELAKMDATMKAQGYRLTDACGYIMNGKPSFSGIWEKI